MHLSFLLPLVTRTLYFRLLPSASQTVLSPFDSPNPITDQLTLKAPGGLSSAGTGQFIATDEENRGVGVVFGQGTLKNAAASFPLRSQTIAY
jgi:hypothetical protein